MRRATGYHYSPLPSEAAAGIEQENDEMTEDLKQKIHTLKSLTIDIGNEVKNHDRLLRDMDDDFERTGGFLRSTMSRVIRLSKGRHNYYFCYMLLFVLLCLFILYFFVIKR